MVGPTDAVNSQYFIARLVEREARNHHTGQVRVLLSQRRRYRRARRIDIRPVGSSVLRRPSCPPYDIYPPGEEFAWRGGGGSFCPVFVIVG